jgi:hypothetical protein
MMTREGSRNSGCKPGKACAHYQHIEDVGSLVLLGWRGLQRRSLVWLVHQLKYQLGNKPSMQQACSYTRDMALHDARLGMGVEHE